jgi:peptidoglycan hydrolase-like protein with peptidoglycan-binding domain
MRAVLEYEACRSIINQLQGESMKQQPRYPFLALIVILIVVSLACSLGGSNQTVTQASPQSQPQGTPLSQNVPSTQAPIVGQPTITPAAPTETPPSGTGPDGCVLNAAFVADLTIPDNTIEAPGAAFVKSWRVKNTGTCNWDASYQLVFAEGNPMSGPPSIPINPTAPGGSVDLAVNLIAPAAPSTPSYIGKWRLKASNGVIFGGLSVIIVVPAPATSAPTSAPTAAPTAGSPIALDWPVLRQGDTGAEVFALQYLLNGRGATITVDGIFGVGTRSAVIAYQDTRGLTKDGVVGPNTWSSLTSGATISQGSSNGDVRAAQYLLHNKFGYNIAVDGIFGPGTKTAVLDFQTTKGLNADGIVGPKTWKALIVVP